MAFAALGLALIWGGPPAQAPALAPEPSPVLMNRERLRRFFAGALPRRQTGPTLAGSAQASSVERPSGTAAEFVDWVAASGDNGGRPFLIVDKLAAEVFVFDAQGGLQGAAPVLVGLARGDDSAPGVGDLPLAAIRPDERTTPAGRFMARFGEGHGHHTVLWVDYADEIALHPVVTAHPRERRLQRLRSPSPDEHRITYGCINVPAAFFRDVVLKVLPGDGGVVYVLPDTRPVEAVFPDFAAYASVSDAASGPRRPGGG
jgi:hypothetical protein